MDTTITTSGAAATVTGALLAAGTAAFAAQGGFDASHAAPFAVASTLGFAGVATLVTYALTVLKG